MTSGWNYTESPFHEGEQRVQERMGVRDIEHWARKVVRDHMPEQHRTFYESLAFLVVGARDAEGRPWATLLTGEQGFISSPDRQSLSITTKPASGDALEGALAEGADLGILGIELATRRRNRVNGRITGIGEHAIEFNVGQSFGNCPQYIRERNWRRIENHIRGEPVRSDRLSGSQKSWISAADTFFIASGYQAEDESRAAGMDASHRGGDRGFVEVVDDTQLSFPDYAGNNHFNTIGNLLLDPRAGLLFINFETGGMLQLTGRTSVNWDAQSFSHIPGARRLINIDIEEVIELPSAIDLRWEADAESVRSLRLVEKIQECEDVVSFLFDARDGGPLPLFEAGQHLPIELHVPGFEEPIRRTYSLSCGPNDARYRISVKRETKGIASRFLHDKIETGAIIDARRPAGGFVLSCSKCPVALVSAGIGVTPMLSMLHALVAEGSDRPIWFVHGARDGAHHPLAEEVRELTRGKKNVQAYVAYSRPRADDRLGVDYDREGRVDGKWLADLTRDLDTHYFVCGPTSFMAEIQTMLERCDVPADQIHTESFGPQK